MTGEEIDELRQGRFPSSLGKDEKAAYQIAGELAGKPGPMSETAWKYAVECMGEEFATAIVFLVAYYSVPIVVMNGLDMRVPEDT